MDAGASLADLFQELQESTQEAAITCSCMVPTMYQLPCRHYFVVVRRFGLELINKNIYGNRWYIHTPKALPLPSSFDIHVPTAITTLVPTAQFERQKEVEVALRNLGEIAGI